MGKQNPLLSAGRISPSAFITFLNTPFATTMKAPGCRTSQFDRSLLKMKQVLISLLRNLTVSRPDMAGACTRKRTSSSFCSSQPRGRMCRLLALHLTTTCVRIYNSRAARSLHHWSKSETVFNMIASQHVLHTFYFHEIKTRTFKT